MFFVMLLLMSVPLIDVSTTLVAKLCVDIPCWEGYHRFLANVNVTDVENLYSVEFKLAWNNTHLSIVKVNITSPEEWGTNYVIFKNETLQNYNATHGRYWLNMSAVDPAPSFNGSTILVELTFDVIAWPFFPYPSVWAHLDLYDTILKDPEDLLITHETYNGLYWIPSAIPCVPSVKVTPDYYEATTLGENFTINIDFTVCTPSFYLTDWKAKLEYNTTLLDVIKVEEGSFLGQFREASKRYFTVSVNEEEGYVNMSGGILGICDMPFGSGSLAKITFNATYVALCSETGTCVLGLSGTNFTDYWTSLMPLYVEDGFYRAPHTKLLGDVNEDGTVDIFDIVIVAAEFGRPVDPPIPITDPRADVNKDGIVDIFDLVMVAADFGKTC